MRRGMSGGLMVGSGLSENSPRRCTWTVCKRSGRCVRPASLGAYSTSFLSVSSAPAPAKNTVSRSSVSLAGTVVLPSQWSKHSASGVNTASARTQAATSWGMRLVTKTRLVHITAVGKKTVARKRAEFRFAGWNSGRAAFFHAPSTTISARSTINAGMPSTTGYARRQTVQMRREASRLKSPLQAGHASCAATEGSIAGKCSLCMIYQRRLLDRRVGFGAVFLAMLRPPGEGLLDALVRPGTRKFMSYANSVIDRHIV